MDQWYMDYGEDSWREVALEYVENKDGKGIETYSSDTRHAFVGVLDWLRQWALSRSYGLGSRLPWDPQFLVESLSDSTVYMSYVRCPFFPNGGAWVCAAQEN
jgi:leucyl-tRNA synthetase